MKNVIVGRRRAELTVEMGLRLRFGEGKRCNCITVPAHVSPPDDDGPESEYEQVFLSPSRMSRTLVVVRSHMNSLRRAPVSLGAPGKQKLLLSPAFMLQFSYVLT